MNSVSMFRIACFRGGGGLFALPFLAIALFVVADLCSFISRAFSAVLASGVIGCERVLKGKVWHRFLHATSIEPSRLCFGSPPWRTAQVGQACRRPALQAKVRRGNDANQTVIGQ